MSELNIGKMASGEDRGLPGDADGRIGLLENVDIDAYVSVAKTEIDQVAALIKSRVPDAGSDVLGGPLDAYGSSVWKPTRAASLDYSAWGPWEVWEHCAIDASGPVDKGPKPTGDWVAWDSRTDSVTGFPIPNAMIKAEMMAVLQNEGKPTRIVAADGSFRESRMIYETVRSTVHTEAQRILAAPQA